MKKLKEIYLKYKPYIRIDLLMYFIMILTIIIYVTVVSMSR
ncbi:hypothetical protein V6R21_25650 [Limibacter armeniacum]